MMNRFSFQLYKWMCGLFVILMLANCGGSRAVSGDTNMTERRKAALANQYRQWTVVPEYQLGYGDDIEIKFFNNIEFNERVRVRPDGRISMAKIGDVFVNGMTPTQLDSLVTARYSAVIVNPDITVIVREFSGYKVYVLGEVRSAGSFDVERNMTILQAVAAAGGSNPDAKLGSVMVLRRGQSGAVEAIQLDLNKPLDGAYGSIAQNDLFVQPQDIVYVPKTSFASATAFIDRVYSTVLPPIDTYLRYLIFQQRN